MATVRKNNARLGFRLNRRLKDLIEQAACIRGQSVSEFATSTLVESARRIVQKHTTTVLSNRDRDIFLALLDADASPNEALRRAAKEFKKRNG